jgi:hypothetical protein
MDRDRESDQQQHWANRTQPTHSAEKNIDIRSSGQTRCTKSKDQDYGPKQILGDEKVYMLLDSLAKWIIAIRLRIMSFHYSYLSSIVDVKIFVPNPLSRRPPFDSS